MRHEVIERANVEQPGGEPRVTEVQLGRSHQPLSDVREPRPKPNDEKARLEQRDPLLCGGARDSRVGTERGEIERLSDPSCSEPYEALKLIQVADLHQFAKIPRYIGLEVVAQSDRGIELVCVDPRVEAGEQEVVGRSSPTRPTQLGDRERKKMKQCGAARE